MRYACLIYTNHHTDPQEGTPEAAQQFQDYMAFGEKWASAIRGGEALLPIGTATAVQVRDGETLVTDGPFAETKEHLGGFYIIDADDLDKAIETARDIPAAKDGTIEVRPIMEFE